MKLTWLGHSAFRLESEGIVALIDPFLSHNPVFGGDVGAVSAGCTHVLLTHGHDDHVGDTVTIAQQQGATVVAMVELAQALQQEGVAHIDMANIGGTIRLNAHVSVTFVPAWHSAARVRNGQVQYLGTPAGLVIKTSGHTVYHMGDTAIFGDMALIHELHRPTVGLVPVGDRFTMGPQEAALACRKYFEFETIVPIHYGTFPLIEQTPDSFVAALEGYNVVVPEVGGAVTLKAGRSAA
jgi:L-ascorbate metabolism protein UlaG (beta-lactamase superfamily)